MTPRWLGAVDAERSLQALPFLFVAALLAAMAMQAKLLTPRAIPMAIPSTVGIPAGAAPQESIPPTSAAVPTPVLPSESMPPDSLTNSAEPSLAATPSARATDGWTDRLPRAVAPDGGAGNINIRTKQPNAISSLLANILRSLKRLHPASPPSAKAIAARLHATPSLVKPRVPAMASTPKPSLAGAALGGAASHRDILGGPAPLAARYATSLNGLTMGPHH